MIVGKHGVKWNSPEHNDLKFFSTFRMRISQQREVKILLKQPASAHDFASRMFTSRLRLFSFSDPWPLDAVAAFLAGTSKDLLGLSPASCAFVTTGFGQKLIERDLEELSRFFEAACRRNRELRSRYQIASDLIAPEELDDLIVLILVRVQIETNYPRPGANAPDAISIRGQSWQSRFQGPHHAGHV